MCLNCGPLAKQPRLLPRIIRVCQQRWPSGSYGGWNISWYYLFQPCVYCDCQRKTQRGFDRWETLWCSCSIQLRISPGCQKSTQWRLVSGGTFCDVPRSTLMSTLGAGEGGGGGQWVPVAVSVGWDIILWCSLFSLVSTLGSRKRPSSG